MPAALIVRIVFWIWFGTALAAGHFLWLQQVPPLAVPGILFGITAAALLAYFAISGVRAWVDSLNLRTLVLLHVTRFVGIYFLYLYQQGELARSFAVPAGIGDIIVATMALPVVFAPLSYDVRLRAIRIWNVVGLIDIALVIATAIRLSAADPSQLRPLTHLPLSLLPTLLVPVIVATHVIIFLRVQREMPAR